MVDVLIVNPPSPDGHIYIRDMCRWGRKSREKMIWPQSSLAYLAAVVPDDMTVRIEYGLMTRDYGAKTLAEAGGDHRPFTACQ